MKWDFAIATKDEKDLKSGHKRKKAGDIIAVKPHPWKWGKKEVKEYLIVTMDGLTEQEAHDKCKPLYKAGTEGVRKHPVTLAKRKHHIPLSSLPIDTAQAADYEKEYQPLKDKVFATSLIAAKSVATK